MDNDNVETIKEFRQRARSAAMRVYEETPDTQWPVNAFEIMLGAYGWLRNDHSLFCKEVGMPEPDRVWWFEQLDNLTDLIYQKGDYN